MSCLAPAKIIFFERSEPSNQVMDCAGRVPSSLHRPTASLHTQAITKQVGGGKILSIVQKEDRTFTPLGSTSRSLVILMVDCLYLKKLAGLYAKSGDFGGWVETAAKYGAYWRVQIDPTKQIPEVAV